MALGVLACFLIKFGIGTAFVLDAAMALTGAAMLLRGKPALGTLLTVGGGIGVVVTGSAFSLWYLAQLLKVAFSI